MRVGDIHQNSHLMGNPYISYEWHTSYTACHHVHKRLISTLRPIVQKCSPGIILSFYIMFLKKKNTPGPILLLQVESVGWKCSVHIQGVSKYS